MGIYLHRHKLIIGEEKRKIALISKKVTLPAFFFSKIIYCKQNWSDQPCPNVTAVLGDVYVLLFWPLYVVSWGFIIGWIVTRLCKTPQRQQKSVFAAVAFANSTGLPITLLAVIHASFPATSELGRIDPTMFLSVYLLLYPVLQWGVGGYLLTDDDEDESVQEITKSDRVRSLSDKFLLGLDTLDALDTHEHLHELEEASHAHITDADLELAEKELLALANEGVAKTYNSMSGGESVTALESDGSVNMTPHEVVMSFWDTFAMAMHKCLTPPVVGALLGMVVAATPLRGIFIDLQHRADKAPLEWLFDGIYSVGQAAIPLNMMILGMNLSASQNAVDESKLLSMPTMIGIVIGKMVIMPLIGIASAILMHRYILNIPDAVHSTFYLVSMIVFICPTANDVMVMVELSGGGAKEGIARVFGLQYLCAPILLSISVTAVVSVASQI
jgi:predicted permease